jgi:hypothetical protein
VVEGKAGIVAFFEPGPDRNITTDVATEIAVIIGPHFGGDPRRAISEYRLHPFMRECQYSFTGSRSRRQQGLKTGESNYGTKRARATFQSNA